MITFEEFTIDDTRYITNKYHTPDALKIFAVVSKMIGKPIGIFAAEGLNGEASPNVLGQAFEAFFDKVDPENFDRVVKDVLKTTKIFTDGINREIRFNTDFQGKTLHLMKVVYHVLMFQFSDFLGELGTVIPATVSVKKAPEAGRIQAL